MSLLALLLGWVLARTIRIVPAGADQPFGPGGMPPSPGPVAPPVPITPVPAPRRPAASSRRPAPAPVGPTSNASTTAPPWPQVMPSGLPAFPGGWEPYSPPPSAVVQRANELLSSLWASGSGSFRVEKTAGVWVLYRATPMAGGKKGVVAYREKLPASVVAPSSSSSPRAAVPVSSPSPIILPTLRQGSRGQEVVIVQQRLGIKDDGIFGPGTDRAVRAHQARHGLKVDGIVGPDTWGSLMGTTRAA